MQVAHDEQELEKAKAINVLPPGTKEAWDAYVDRRISSMLQRSGSTIQLVDFESKILNKTTFVSVTSPYIITCDMVAGSIKFPQTATKYGDDIETVTLYIYLLGQDSRLLRDHSALNTSHMESVSEKSIYINPDVSEEQPPPLGVDVESVAAEELRQHLCQRITDKVQSIFAQQPQADVSVK